MSIRFEPEQTASMLLLLVTWALAVAEHPSQIVIETWPEPSVPLAVTVLNPTTV